MPTDAFNPDEDQNGIRGFGSGVSQGQSGTVPYASTGGTTPIGGSPGFVNLGQMLALNGQSGQQSAGMLNKKVNNQALGAENEVKDASNKFKQQSDAATNQYDPNANLAKATTGAQSGAYKGPNNMSETTGVDLTKTRTDLNNALNGLSSIATPDAMAGVAAQNQSLSPRQAAASSFYMGNSNPLFSNTSDRFKGLSGMMGNEMKNSMAYAKNNALVSAGNASKYGGLQAIRQNEADDQAKADALKHMQDLRNQDNANTAGRNRLNHSGMTPVSDQSFANRLGMSYDEWINAGSPSSDQDPKYAAWRAAKAKQQRGM